MIPIVAILFVVTTLSILVGNVTDGLPRLAIVEEEDFSVSVYETINGTTRQIDGYDNFTAFIESFLTVPTVLGQPVAPTLDPNPFENLTLDTQGLESNMSGALSQMEAITQQIEKSGATSERLNQQLIENIKNANTLDQVLDCQQAVEQNKDLSSDEKLDQLQACG